ncbi:MAG: nucleotidyltransferase [Methanomicrobiales archaeon]|nr:nucleotidyltransferase [Methanomicrobiales archaeon]
MHPLPWIRQNFCTIRKCYGVARIGTFGSVVGNETTAASDIDTLVEFRDGEEAFDHFMPLKFYLEVFQGQKADLVIIDMLNPRIQGAVLGEIVSPWVFSAQNLSLHLFTAGERHALNVYHPALPRYP